MIGKVVRRQQTVPQCPRQIELSDLTGGQGKKVKVDSPPPQQVCDRRRSLRALDPQRIKRVDVFSSRATMVPRVIANQREIAAEPVNGLVDQDNSNVRFTLTHPRLG